MCRAPSTAIATNQITVIGPKKAATPRGAVALHREQRNQDHDRDRDHVMFERRRGEFQTFDRRQHRDRGRDEGIAEEHRGPDHAEHEDQRGAPAERAHRKRRERERAALPVIVGAQQDQHVFRGHHQEQRPQDHRQHAEHDVARQRSAVPGRHARPRGRHRAGWCRYRRRRRRPSPASAPLNWRRPLGPHERPRPGRRPGLHR